MSDHPTLAARLYAVIYGDVQGVGFRAHTQREAVRLRLTGWVRNQWDGSVETVAEGPRDRLQQFEVYLNRGPSAAHVERVEARYDEATGEFHAFHIRY